MSQTEKHTPGPWETGCGKNGTIAIVAREWETPLVANVSAKDRSSEEAEANAQLMATAPELLALAQRLAAWDANVNGSGFELEKICKQARAAIKKATGQK